MTALYENLATAETDAARIKIQEKVTEREGILNKMRQDADKEQKKI